MTRLRAGFYVLEGHMSFEWLLVFVAVVAFFMLLKD